MLKTKIKATLWLFCFLLLVVGIWGYCHMEVYCFFCPSIDTTFSKAFSEESFSQVRPGMPKADVLKMLGEPLSIVEHPDQDETWWYSQDGRCRFGDFAWLGRSVRFTNSVVMRAESKVYED